VVFSRLEQNARVIKIRVFVIDPKLYYDVQNNLNLAVLEILEKEEIDHLHIELEKEIEDYKKMKEV
ncbi:MAG: mechanosensitive ion channel protein MscS, partial [Moorea sp. SIO3H5]|nr:mechanosensitive ion channel protein MscS [Moorena sp. SIO3H5]